MSALQPLEVRLAPDKRSLAVRWADGNVVLQAEYLRVESPSAEVKGHGPSDARLVGGKQNVTITALEPVGAYALKITFSDGHSTGLYTWEYLRELGQSYVTRWQAYLEDLEKAGMNREMAAIRPRGLASRSKLA